jgi:hypothetical protein
MNVSVSSIVIQLSMTVVFPLLLDICFVDRRSGGCPS